MHDPNRRLDAGSRLPLAPGLVCTGLVCAGLLAASLLPTAARAACTPTSPANDATVTCSGTDSTGYDGSGADNLTISTTGAAILDDSSPTLDAAILVDDDSTVTIGAEATVRVTEQNGAGIRGDDDNIIDNRGRIELLGDDTRGISIDQNTTGILPNGAVNGTTGVIEVDGNRSYAIETGNNTGVANSGTINLDGNETRGLSGGDRLDYTKPANVTNGGTINVNGADSFGMRFGDGWLEGTLENADGRRNTPDEFVPAAGAIRNLRPGTINVSGARSTGIYAGEDSFVINTGTINVTGTDAVGISVTGNSRLERFDLGDLDLTALNPFGLATVVNQRQQQFGDIASITGDADAGPLVVFRNFSAGRENRLYNGFGLGIVADLTNLGTADRGVAIRGTDGEELIGNQGRIQGDIEFLGGDDRYVHFAGASLTGAGKLYGGSGQDVAILAGGNGGAASFDLSRLDAFETLQITAGSDWSLTNTSGFTGLTEVLDGAGLDVPTPITLGGDLRIADGGAVRVTLDGAATPLTVQGATSLDGTLVVAKGTNLALSTTPYRALQANGSLTGRFDRIVLPVPVGSKVFSTEYVADGLLVTYQDVGLVAMARSSNQRAVAAHLVELTNATGSAPDLQALLDDLQDTTNVARIYTALSPEGYDAQTTVSVEAGRRIASMLFERPRECREGDVDPWNPDPNVLPCHPYRVSPWVTALGSFRSRDGFSGHNGYDAQMGGIIAGLDFRPIDPLALTIAVSSQHGTIDVERAGESELTLAEVSVGGSFYQGPFRAQGLLTYGHGYHEDQRDVSITNPDALLPATAEDSHDSDRILVAGELGYLVPVGPVGIEPLVGFDWAWIKQDSIRETNAGGFNLLVDERDEEVGSARAGLRISSVHDNKAYLGPWLEWATGVWRPSFEVAWREYVAGDSRDVRARLQGAPDTAGGFTVQSQEDSGGAEIGVAFRFVPTAANRLRFDVRYNAYVAEHTLEQNLLGQVAITF